MLLLILLTAAFLRLHQLSSAPPGVSGDEVFNAIDARQISLTHWPVFFEGNYGRESLFFYLMALSSGLFGATIWAIRLPAALLGVGTVLLTYLIGRNLFDKRTALIAAGLIAVSLWPVMASRWALRAISLTFFTALTVYFLARGMGDLRSANGRYRDWILGGISLGLTLYTYIPARVFPLVILIWLGWWLATKHTAKSEWRKQAARIGVSLLVGLLVFAPFGVYMLRYPEKVNQRLDSLSGGALVGLQEGDVTALREPLIGVIQMFTIQGDRDTRYHLTGKPMFDWVTGTFFYIGLGLCVWGAFKKRRLEIGDSSNLQSPIPNSQSSYALLLLWIGAMLLPNMLVDSNPSFLRAAGSMVPIYLTTAVAISFIWLQAEKRLTLLQKPYWLLAIMFVWLALITQDTWHSYFNLWNNDPQVRHIYEANLAQIGHYLNENPPPPETAVYIGHEYAFDAAPRIFAFSSDTPVNWFTPSNTLPYPPAEQGSWYLIPSDESIHPQIAALLDDQFTATAVTFPDQQPSFILYQPRNLTWTPHYTTNIPFNNGPTLIGYDLPDELYRGEPATITLYWHIPPDQPRLANQLVNAQIILADNSGNIWNKSSGLLGYPQAHWQSNGRFRQHLTLDIPQGMLPGAAHLQFDLFRMDGTVYNRPPNNSNRSTDLTIRSRPLTNFTPAPDMPVWDETLVLRDTAFSTLLSPGVAIDLALNWVALQQPPQDYRVQLDLQQPGQTEPFLSQTVPIWPDVYPPTTWQPGEQISSFHRLIIPLDIPTDSNPELRLHLLPADGNTPLPFTSDNKLADMTLSLRDHSFAIPPMQTPLAPPAQFGSSIQLLGYDLDTSRARSGGDIGLTLYWQALATPDNPYTVFNHLLTAAGQLAAQFDSPPVSEAWLTNTWLPGEIITDERLIPLGDGLLDNGRYALVVGLYTASNGQRLPVTVDGTPQLADQLVLTEITLDGSSP